MIQENGGEKVTVGFNTPLYLAIKANNYKSVDLILDYMSRIEFNSSRNIMSVFPRLVNYKLFIKYMTYLPVQTFIMQTKQVMRAQYQYNNQIVKFQEASSIQIDEHFFRNRMGEVSKDSATKETKNFPISVIAVRVAWILNMKEGKEFLWSIYLNENYAYYKIHSVILIIEFLYTRFKNFLLKWLMTAYIIQVILYHTVLYCFEKYVGIILTHKSEPNEEGIVWINAESDTNSLKITIFIVLFLNNLMTIVYAYSQLLLASNMGLKAYFKSFYSIIDVTYISMTFIVTALMVYQLS